MERMADFACKTTPPGPPSPCEKEAGRPKRPSNPKGDGAHPPNREGANENETDLTLARKKRPKCCARQKRTCTAVRGNGARPRGMENEFRSNPDWNTFWSPVRVTFIPPSSHFRYFPWPCVFGIAPWGRLERYLPRPFVIWIPPSGISWSDRHYAGFFWSGRPLSLPYFPKTIRFPFLSF